MAEQLVEPVFVEFIPEQLVAGKLYISTRFRTASHLCACGCGLKVVTPIKPAKWCFTYDGETITLSPSVGRWQLPCKSHYCIIKNRIVWARPFSEEEMKSVQQRDARDAHLYYENRLDIPDQLRHEDARQDLGNQQKSMVGRLRAKISRSLKRRRDRA